MDSSDVTVEVEVVPSLDTLIQALQILSKHATNAARELRRLQEAGGHDLGGGIREGDARSGG